ncbi:MAG TPA: hypothetical protein VJ302_16790 [Blastocatellia bacterium]|nr:hypothetical protein [Blastocatellia bacterium]
MPTKKILEKAEGQVSSAADLAAGITTEDRDRLQTIIRAQDAEQEIEANADPLKQDDDLYISVERRIDSKTLLRSRVKLTPSMCTVQGCGFDAAVHFGFKKGWADVPADQMFDAKRTVGDVVIDGLEKHKASKHRYASAHIVTGKELQEFKQQSQLPPGFLSKAGVG